MHEQGPARGAGTGATGGDAPSADAAGLPLAAERAQVAAAARRLAAAGLVLGTSGNVSLRTGDRIAVSPTGAVLATLTADDVPVVDRAGRVVAGHLAPTSELDLHLALHDRDRDAPTSAVVHTHAPIATAVGLVVDELPCVHYEMLALGGTVRVAPYATFGTPALAAHVAAAMEGRTAAILANHGTVAVGATVAAAVDATELLERSADLYWRAAQLGTPRTLDAAARADVVRAVAERGYGTTRPIEEDPA
jgi:L-fuculose-phosphate aldolase